MKRTKRLLIFDHEYPVGTAKRIHIHAKFNGKEYSLEMAMPIIRRTLKRDEFIVNVFPPVDGRVTVKVYERLNTWGPNENKLHIRNISQQGAQC